MLSRVNWCFGLRAETVKTVSTCGGLNVGESEWVLLDSGSVIHACSKETATDVKIEPTSMRSKLQTVTGSKIAHYGRKDVELDLGDKSRVRSKIGFEVKDVGYTVLSLGRILSSGADMNMKGKTDTLTHKGMTADIKVDNNVLMIRATRPHGQSRWHRW